MTTQQNSTGPVPDLPGEVSAQNPNPPSLVELANQLTSESSDNPNVAPNQPRKPQVVFVEQSETPAFSQIIEIQIDAESMAQAEAGLAEAAEHAELAQEDVQIPVALQNENEMQNENATPNENATAARFAIDPFLYEVDGKVPEMPTLPIVDSKQLTERVIARETSGEHFAWRLLAEPEVIEIADTTEEISPNGTEAQTEPNETWTETEVVAQGDGDAHGDCFYAKPGQVISIDGNQGFDHIDLRSYNIDHATFQPGTILLRSEIDPEAANEDAQSPPPISIRHRGVRFAIFNGEVRVEL
jgi:hypothetical protein